MIMQDATFKRYLFGIVSCAQVYAFNCPGFTNAIKHGSPSPIMAVIARIAATDWSATWQSPEHLKSAESVLD
jgi:hypothetical protein